MPVFHFDVSDDVNGTSPDWTGTDLPDSASAKWEAVRLAGEMIADNAVLKRHGGEWHLEVTDHTGAPLFHLDFLVRPASAGLPAHGPLTSAAHLSNVGAR